MTPRVVEDGDAIVIPVEGLSVGGSPSPSA